jgi:phage terminase large subunit GpA-like protein
MKKMPSDKTLIEDTRQRYKCLCPKCGHAFTALNAKNESGGDTE